MFGMVGKYFDNPASKSQSSHSALLMIGTLTSCNTVGAGSYFPKLDYEFNFLAEKSY